MKLIKPICLVLTSCFYATLASANPFQLFDLDKTLIGDQGFLKLKKNTLSGYINDDWTSLKRVQSPYDWANQEITIAPVNLTPYHIANQLSASMPNLTAFLQANHAFQDENGVSAMNHLLEQFDLPQNKHVAKVLNQWLSVYSTNYSPEEMMGLLQSIADNVDILPFLSMMETNDFNTPFLHWVMAAPDIIPLLNKLVSTSGQSREDLVRKLKLILYNCPNFLVLIVQYAQQDQWCDAFLTLYQRLVSTQASEDELRRYLLREGNYQAQLWLFEPLASHFGIDLSNTTDGYSNLTTIFKRYLNSLDSDDTPDIQFNEPLLTETVITLMAQHPEFFIQLLGTSPRNLRHASLTSEQLTQFANWFETVAEHTESTAEPDGQTSLATNVLWLYSNPLNLALLHNAYTPNVNPQNLQALLSPQSAIYQNPPVHLTALASALTSLFTAIEVNDHSEGEIQDEILISILALALEQFYNNHTPVSNDYTESQVASRALSLARLLRPVLVRDNFLNPVVPVELGAKPRTDIYGRLNSSVFGGGLNIWIPIFIRWFHRDVFNIDHILSLQAGAITQAASVAPGGMGLEGPLEPGESSEPDDTVDSNDDSPKTEDTEKVDPDDEDDLYS